MCGAVQHLDDAVSGQPLTLMTPSAASRTLSKIHDAKVGMARPEVDRMIIVAGLET